MTNFKINIGSWQTYRADGSLDLPSSTRHEAAWTKTLTEAYNLDYTVADQTPLLPNNWYWDIYYCAALGTAPTTVGTAPGVTNSTWITASAGTWSTSLDADTDCYNGYRLSVLSPTTVNNRIYFKHDFAGCDWYDNINNATGWTVLWRCKNISCGTTSGQRLYFEDGTYYSELVMLAGSVSWESASYNMDTTDDYHTYKAVVVGTGRILYVDDVEVINTTGSTGSGTKRIMFGDPSLTVNIGGETYWDFFTYYTGAEPTLLGTDDRFVIANTYGDNLPILTGTTLDISAAVTGTRSVFYVQNVAGQRFFDDISNAEGYVINANPHIKSTGAGGGQVIDCYDGVYHWQAELKGNYVSVDAAYIAEATSTCGAAFFTDYHDLKAVVLGTSLKVYVDNILGLDLTLDASSATKSLSFGDVAGTANQGGQTYWNYFKAKTFREAFAGVVATTSTSVESGYCLDIDTVSGTAPTDALYYAHDSGTAPFFVNVDNTRGYTIEAQVKVIDGGSTCSQSIRVQDDSYDFRVWLLDDRISVNAAYIAEATQEYVMDTTTDFHKYRFTVKGTALTVYVDGVPRITGTLDLASTTQGVRFGDGSTSINRGGRCFWGYIRYRTDGAFAPNESVDDGWVYSNFDITDKRRLSTSEIIRSSNAIIPAGKMNPAKIKVKGTISGGNWAGLRSVVRRLKRMLNLGTQKIYIDDTHYIEGVHTGLTYRPVTQDYAEFTANFDCRSPFWKQEWASYFSTSPVHAQTFYITNDSDVEVPCKIVMTGPAGTSATNFLFENVTLEQKYKYVGTLAQTSELIIDKGFQNYNEYAVKIGTGSVFSSFEGDLITLQPGLNALVYGSGEGGVIGTIELYWRMETHI